jgi:hypothetical protein
MLEELHMRGVIAAVAGLSIGLFIGQAMSADELTTTTVQRQTVMPGRGMFYPTSRSTMMITGSSPSRTSSSYEKFNQWGGSEHYAYRLSQMRLQLDKGKGALSDDQFSRLDGRYHELASLESRVRADGFPKAESDDLEKQLNMFNVDVSHALGSQTAGAGEVR